MAQHTIVGGGIIGLMCAYYLSEAGRQVTVIDRLVPGDDGQASYGNAGGLAVGSVMPLGEPGLIWQGLKMLVTADSSLSIPWRYRLAIMPWLVRLLRESSAHRQDQNAQAISQLNALSNRNWRALISDLNLQDEFRDSGWLKLFESDAAMAAMATQKPYLDAVGLSYQQLTADEVRQLEPSLGHQFRHGMLQSQAQTIRQPHRLLIRLADQLQRRGVIFLQGEAREIKPEADQFVVTGPDLKHRCSALTVCAGAWSQRLLATLGDTFPLETERGYHLQFSGHSELSRSVMHMEKHLVLSPMDDGLRMTAGVELAGLDAPADFAWVRRKVAIARQILPSVDFTEQSTWLGFRPSLPDSVPVIGAHPRWPNLTLAFGHGHLGMTQSAATGHLLAQTIQGLPSDIPIGPYRADRF